MRKRREEKREGACSSCTNKHQHFHSSVSTSCVFSNSFHDFLWCLCSGRILRIKEEGILGIWYDILRVEACVWDLRKEWLHCVSECEYEETAAVEVEILRAAIRAIFECQVFIELRLRAFRQCIKQRYFRQAYMKPFVLSVWWSGCVICVFVASAATAWLSSRQHLSAASRRWWLMPFSSTFVADASVYAHYRII